MAKALAITGMGAVTAAGIGVDPLWAACRDGRSLVTPLTSPGFEKARVRIAAQLADFDASSHLPPDLVVDRFSAFALVAAAEALSQAGLHEPLGAETAVIIGTGIGGAVTSDRGSRTYYTGEGRPDPMSIPKIMPSAAASQVGMRHGARGPTFAVSSACASSAQAVGLGMQMVRAGMVRRVVVGGSEAMLVPSVMRTWELLRVLSPAASRPFSANRDGMVLGEGAGILVIETLEDAATRGAEPLALLLGYGTSSDAADLLRPDVTGASASMASALADAGLTSEDIGYVNAHGTGTVANDAVESAALAAVFGTALPNLPISSTKPVHGHTIGAAGAIELIVTVSALRAQTAPPTINWISADPHCAVDAVPNQARPAAIRAAMSNSFAFGGINASLVVGLA